MASVRGLDEAKETVRLQLEDVLGHPVDASSLTDDTSLDAIGMDSLLVITALVMLSEACGADLAEHEDTLDPPQSVGDLIALTAQFMAAG